MTTNFQKDKLRGGYYTPHDVATWLTQWGVQNVSDTVLEPSCGDGIFLDTTIRKFKELGISIRHISRQVTGIEIVPEEAEKAVTRIKAYGSCLNKCVMNDDFFYWAHRNRTKRFDCVIGNPPFIRYQNFPASSRSTAISIMTSLGLKPNKLTNIWVPFVAISTSLLRPGGRLALVLPAELLQVTYATQLRAFLADNFKTIRIFTCNDMLFQRAEQEVILLLAEGKVDEYSNTNRCRIDLIDTPTRSHLLEHSPYQKNKRRAKTVNHESEKWLKYFLNSREISFLRALRKSDLTTRLGDFANVDVGVVTGRNSFFVLNKDEIGSYGIQDYVLPLVGRSAQLQGTLIKRADLNNLAVNGKRVFLFYIEPGTNGSLSPNAKAYIALGEKLGIHKGYKCSIRKEWYCVPSVWIPQGFIFRQIYDFPRFVVNKSRATSTDTIHRVKCSHIGLSSHDCNTLERIWTKMRDRRMARGKRNR